MDVRRIGITGQTGFLGYHLFHTLRVSAEKLVLVDCLDEYFADAPALERFVNQCDVIVHLAAMNRGDERVLYETNVALVQKLIQALERKSGSTHVMLSSSIQRALDNPYGRSKADGERKLAEWAKKSGNMFTALVIPNVFGPFSKPFYNSAVATFCHQLTHDEEPTIIKDQPVRLIYVGHLCRKIEREIANSFEPSCRTVTIEEDAQLMVSQMLAQLSDMRNQYTEGLLPKMESGFDVSLFNTLRSFYPYDHFPLNLKVHLDERGYLFESLKTQTGGQVFVSSTRPGITRGNHFHFRKIERFCVISGEAIIRLRKVGTTGVIEYRVSGEEPCAVDIPVLHAHNITNFGDRDLTTMFWANELFDDANSDTYAEQV